MKTPFTQEQNQDTAVRLGIPDHPFFQRRITRAYDLVETNKVHEVSHEEGLYRVHSQSDEKIYTVELNHGNPHCTCPDGERTIFCKHSIASMLVALEAKPKARAAMVYHRVARAKLVVYDDTFDKRNGKRHSKYGRWIVNDYKVRKGYVVYSDEHGKLHCACGKKNCRHCKAIRKVTAEGVPTETVGIAPRDDGKRIENECGTSEAKSLQDELNGNNGTGDNNLVHHQLDTSNPFQECEQLDIDQIEGRSNGDLVHVLSNGEYVISYRGIMKLAEQHGVTFEASRHDATRTVIAYGRCGSNSRASGKPINGSEMTAIELAKRNTARQLLPLPEIKALEHKAKFEGEFDWQVAKRKCLEIVPDFTFDILLTDLVRDGKIAQKHSSDYSRKEWLVIFDACKRDAETNGNDDDGGDDPPSSDDEQPIAVCSICNRTLTNKLSVSRCIGPECFKKVGAKGAPFLQDDEVSDELIEASQLYQDEALQKRILRACLTLDAPAPVKVLNWLGNEYFGYRNRPILYYFCAAGQLNRIDTSNRKLRYIIVTRDTAETELDAHALAQMAVDVAEEDALERTGENFSVSPCASTSATREEPLGTMDEFVERCKEAEATVEDTIADDADTPTNGDGKRKLQIDKKRNIVLIEPDGTKKPMTFTEVSRTFGGDVIMRLTQGIQLCGADISTVELDN